jgi:hypothetical protein
MPKRVRSESERRLRRRLYDAQKRLCLEELHSKQLEHDLACLRNLFVSTFSPPLLAVNGRAWAPTLGVAWARTLCHGDVFLVFLVSVDGAMHNFGFLTSHTQMCVVEGDSPGSCVVNLTSTLSRSSVSLVFRSEKEAAAFVCGIFADSV